MAIRDFIMKNKDIAIELEVWESDGSVEMKLVKIIETFAIKIIVPIT